MRNVSAVLLHALALGGAVVIQGAPLAAETSVEIAESWELPTGLVAVTIAHKTFLSRFSMARATG